MLLRRKFGGLLSTSLEVATVKVMAGEGAGGLGVLVPWVISGSLSLAPSPARSSVFL